MLAEAQMMNTIEYRIDCQLLTWLHEENNLGCRRVARYLLLLLLSNNKRACRDTLPISVTSSTEGGNWAATWQHGVRTIHS